MKNETQPRQINPQPINVERISSPEQQIPVTVVVDEFAAKALKGHKGELILKDTDDNVVFTGEAEPDATDADHEE